MPMQNPPHPGRSILRDCVEPLGMSLEETAKQLGVSEMSLSSVINGESSITFQLAVGLDKLFGGGASTWYQLQSQYDEAQAANREAVPEESESPTIHRQTAIRHLDHGRVVYETYDDEVIALRVLSTDEPKLAGKSSHDRVEFRFVGEGPGAVRIRMVYQPSADASPDLIADVLFTAYLEWNAEADQYFGHIDASEWNRASEELYAAKEKMNDLYALLGEQHFGPAPDADNLLEHEPEPYGDVLKGAERLLHKGTASVRASELAGV